MMSLNSVQLDNEDFQPITDEEEQEAFQHWGNAWYRPCKNGPTLIYVQSG